DAVRNSSDYSKDTILTLNPYVPQPFLTNRLMLSALGAYVDIDGVWDGPFNSLVEWKNRSTLARDHFVRIVNRGRMHPWGHRCVLVRVSERKFANGNGDRGAYVFLRAFLVVTEPVRTYPGAKGLSNEGRQLPFQHVEVVTRVSPDFGDIDI